MKNSNTQFVNQSATEQINVNKKLVLEMVKSNGLMLKHFANIYGDDMEVVAVAVNNNAKAFAYASKRLRESRVVASLFVAVKEDAIEEILKNKDENGNFDFNKVSHLKNQITTIIAIHKETIKLRDSEKSMSETR